jgi:phosphate-selective porin
MNAKNLFIASVLGAAAAFSSAYVAAQEPATNLTAKVDTAIRSAGLVLVFPKADSKGVVSLNGQVNSDYDARRAASIARSIPGVTGVVNALDVHYD